MPKKRQWTDEDKKLVKNLSEETNLSWDEIGQALGTSGENARAAYRRLSRSGSSAYARLPRLLESPYPKYNNPLEQEGDCLILPDTEFPFHHAEFVNNCLELAYRLGVKNCNIAGDAVHFNSISHWEANWKARAQAQVSGEAYTALLESVFRLPLEHRDQVLETLNSLAPATDGDVGSELEVTRSCFEALGEQFDDVVYVIGNHDGRLLSALNSPMFAGDLKRFVMGDNPKYRVAEYYHSLLHTEGGTYRITHPNSAAKNAAVSLAAQFHQHVIMGHSHNYSREYDPSGRYWAIQTGCCVDERRLAYAAQRDRGSRRHALGAVLVYGGYPWDLSEKTPWAQIQKIAG